LVPPPACSPTGCSTPGLALRSSGRCHINDCPYGRSAVDHLPDVRQPCSCLSRGSVCVLLRKGEGGWRTQLLSGRDPGFRCCKPDHLGLGADPGRRNSGPPSGGSRTQGQIRTAPLAAARLGGTHLAPHVTARFGRTRFNLSGGHCPIVARSTALFVQPLLSFHGESLISRSIINAASTSSAEVHLGFGG